MDGCLMQNTMNTFSEARYLYLNENIMVIFDHHSKSCLVYSLLTKNSVSKVHLNTELKGERDKFNQNTCFPCSNAIHCLQV